jgi:dsRNA-specific ribonuclease
VFERAVRIGERTVAVGKGKNQKAADSAAAEAALDILKRENEKTTEVSLESLAKLREYAAKNKLPSPEFRDLGESAHSSANAREYIIECRFAGKSSSGTAASKQQARAIAAAEMLRELTRSDRERARAAVKSADKSQVKRKISPSKKAAGAKKSEKIASPKKAPHQHKKHL